MNLRREAFCSVLLFITLFVSSVGTTAPEPELDEVIDLTKVVKPKKETSKSTKRESQESEIENQVNEYGEGGSGLKKPDGKKSVGESLSSIEEKKAPDAPSATPTEATKDPESNDSEPTAATEEAVADSEDASEDNESANIESLNPKDQEENSGLSETEQAEAINPEPIPEEQVSDSQETPAPVSSYNPNPVHGNEHHECSCSKRTQFEPYKERRQRWATLFNIGTNFFNPTQYEPEYAVGSFSDLYGQGAGETIDLSIGAKLNLGNAGALAVLVGWGQFRKAASNGSSLSLNPITAGAVYYLDTLFREPYVVPYFGGGTYTLQYRETLASNAVGGRTGFGFYYVAGLAFQLDWMDEYGDLHQFEESEVENTFLYVEARGTSAVLTPESIRQKDFSNMLHAAAGLRFEF